MLRGVAAKLENHHQVRIAADAVAAGRQPVAPLHSLAPAARQGRQPAGHGLLARGHGPACHARPAGSRAAPHRGPGRGAGSAAARGRPRPAHGRAPAGAGNRPGQPARPPGHAGRALWPGKRAGPPHPGNRGRPHGPEAARLLHRRRRRPVRCGTGNGRRSHRNRTCRAPQRGLAGSAAPPARRAAGAMPRCCSPWSMPAWSPPSWPSGPAFPWAAWCATRCSPCSRWQTRWRSASSASATAWRPSRAASRHRARGWTTRASPSACSCWPVPRAWARPRRRCPWPKPCMAASKTSSPST